MITVAIAIFATQLLFMVLQTVALLLYSGLVLGARFSFTNPSLLSIPVLLLGVLALLALGFSVSAILPNTRSATMAGNLLNLVVIFLGGVFFPTTVWPRAIQPLTWINPLTWITECLRKSFLYGTMNIDVFWIELGAVSLIMIFFTLLGLKFFKYE